MKEDIINRRSFFKQAIKSALPILVGATILPSLVSCERDDEDLLEALDRAEGNGCYGSSCSSSCSGGCYGGCSSGCSGSSKSSTCTSCSSSCSGSCSGNCENTSSNNGNDDNDGVSSASGTISGYEYVDLGLSVKWARYNIGASSPEKYGTYHIFASPSNSITNLYDDLMNAGYFGGDKSISGSKFDTATSKWGNEWQMPSKEHFKELIQSCKQEIITYKNVKGILFTSNKNKNSIFFPFAGYYWRRDDGWEKINEGDWGEYWTGFFSKFSAYLIAALSIRMTKNGAEYKESRTSEIFENKYPIRPVTSDSNNPNNCQNSCTANCANNSTSNVCSNCGSNCSGGCKTQCDYNCAATCVSHCYGSCDDTCGGSCTYLSAGSNCSGCANTCNGRCYHACSYACSSNCQSSCVNGSK